MILRRYINFEKFVYLLKDGLFCPKSSLFEDQWEGLIALPDRQNDDRYIINFSQAREWIYVSCWHMETAESYAMWKIYGEHQYSVCIETTKSKLEQLFHKYDSAYAIYSGKVDYYRPYDAAKPVSFEVLRESTIILEKGIWPYATNHFQKHEAYSFEEEYRLVIIDEGFNWDTRNELHGITLKIEPKEIIEGVIISPRAADWFYDVVEDVLSKYSLSLTVRKSNLQLQHKS